MSSSIKIVILIALPFLIQSNFFHAQSEDPVPNSRYYINDAVSNYIYGENGVEKYFSMLTSSALAIKCPIDKPFTADGITCFQCTLDAPIFNFSTLKCENC